MKDSFAKISIGDPGIDSSPSYDDIFSVISKGLSDFAIVEQRDNKSSETLAEKIRYKEIDSSSRSMVKYLLDELTLDDFEKLGRSPKDIKGITYGDMESIGKPIPMGGAGGTTVEYIVKLLETSDAAIGIAALGALSSVIKQLLQSLVDRTKGETISVQIEDFSFNTVGLSKKDSLVEFEKYFSKYLDMQSNKDSLPELEGEEPVESE